MLLACPCIKHLAHVVNEGGRDHAMWLVIRELWI